MELNFQYSANITFKHVVDKIEPYTFPSILKKTQTMSIYEPYTGVWAIRDNKMTGLILADKNPRGYAEIFSFFVIPEERNKGIGNQLLAMLTSLLQKQGIKQIQTRYRSDWGSLKVIEKMLKSHGWSAPQLIRIIAEIDIGQYVHVPWPKIILPPECILFSWNELSDKDRQQIERMMEAGEIPPEFNPYQHEDKICFPVSVGMRHKGILAGWNIVYSLSENKLEYNNLYLCPDYRMSGYAITMLHRSFGEQYKMKIPTATWVINADNKPIMKIAQRIASGHVNKLVEVKASRKLFK